MNEEEPDETTIKTENRNRNEENRRQIIDFIADNGISDAKSISKTIGLKSSRTRDYLKQLVDEGILEVEGEYKSWKYRIKK
jgi:predicted transcriptional regulator